MGLVLERSTPVQESQMQKHPRFKAFPQQGDSFSSFLGVPLIEHRRSFGVLVVHTTEPRTFSPLEVQLLSSIATQISSLVSKALLLKELDIATQEPSFDTKSKGNTLHFSGSLLLMELRLEKQCCFSSQMLKNLRKPVPGPQKVRCLILRQQWIIPFLIHWN